MERHPVPIDQAGYMTASEDGQGVGGSTGNDLVPFIEYPP
jgi:hypothetical protein